ncbi:hypothetical protein [Nitrosomonas sp. sh817]|uniref:hypothetical protein n=1 Tax=Nitrosomonas sp. sh817 TaxID=3070658 RepID=UPI0027DB8A80|nr:hypothetical protein [Nitrosomonas sp. sh817]WMJ08829.1 hypothetical protein RBH92_01090 [Nitrosomonas sp. sh817]
MMGLLKRQVNIDELVNFVAQQFGGKRPDLAQAGGTQPARLSEALGGVKGWIERKFAT